MVKINTSVTFDLHELALYTYGATRVAGSQFLMESGALIADYATKQMAAVNRHFVPKPLQPVTRFTVKRLPVLALASGVGVAAYAYGQTNLGQKTRVRHLYGLVRGKGTH